MYGASFDQAVQDIRVNIARHEQTALGRASSLAVSASRFEFAKLVAGDEPESEKIEGFRKVLTDHLNALWGLHRGAWVVTRRYHVPGLSSVAVTLSAARYADSVASLARRHAIEAACSTLLSSLDETGQAEKQDEDRVRYLSETLQLDLNSLRELVQPGQLHAETETDEGAATAAEGPSGPRDASETGATGILPPRPQRYRPFDLSMPRHAAELTDYASFPQGYERYDDRWIREDRRRLGTDPCAPREEEV